MLGIIGAMEEEINEIKESIVDIEEVNIGNFIFYKGKINSKAIVLVECGIGKVNASVCTTLLVSVFGAQKVFFTGVAGGVSNTVDIGDIVIGTYLMEHDYDVTAFGYKPGIIPKMGDSKFYCDRDLIELAYCVANENFEDNKIWKGPIVSGDQFVASERKIEWLFKEFGAYCTEMEGAAVAHVCTVLKVPYLVIRSISDKANSDAKVDFKEFCKIAAKKSKLLIIKMIEKI
ncbi:5'-methylthioadenosine/adenosylhomocysteine nucleosidase [Fusobacterium sp. PH5-44]|uniref:5'-methylthioadenosine/adenosylhomocysteine nucleosidase n=1 Tax=unclassified Fusobacterium TaxID=2648384 RepID=UPI003D211044